MAQIVKKTQNKGFTLIELLVYMSIFSIILLIVNSSTFYLQKIIQNNNSNYYIKSQIYFNLNILQQYLYRTNISIEDNKLNFFDRNNNLILTQKLENSEIKNVYLNKEFNLMESIYFQKYNMSFIDSNKVLRIEMSWKDNRGKTQNLTEYLIVINQNI
jgi:prepilin-type N-terminal cleavage/methylation domain-containing protein